MLRALDLETSGFIAHELRNSPAIVGGLARRLYEKIIGNDPDKREVEIVVDGIRVIEGKVARITRIGNKNEES